MTRELLRLTKNGIYCPRGDFYIDASGKVEKNIVTHAHSDHARPGHISYLAHENSLPLLKSRLGKRAKVQTLKYHEEIGINGVRVSLYPSGHIYGAAQVKVDFKGDTWVVSGDYKLEDDQVSTPFEPVSCNVFITECTFGLPVYHWPDQQLVYNQINEWWRTNKAAGITSILFGYSLGKSQRIIRNIEHSIGPVYVHKTVGSMNEAIMNDGGFLPKTKIINEHTVVEEIKGNLIISPPSGMAGQLAQNLAPVSTSMASGWVQSGRNLSNRIHRGFILSDHADWDGLLNAIKATNAERVITMHGYTKELSRWLNEKGINSMEIEDLKDLPYSL